MPQYEQMDLLSYIEDMEGMAAVEADIAKSEGLLRVIVRRIFSEKERLIKFCSRSLNRLQSFIFSSLTVHYPIKPADPSTDLKNMKSEEAGICLSSARINKTIPAVKRWGSQSALRIQRGLKNLQILFQQRLMTKDAAVCKSSEKRIEKNSESYQEASSGQSLPMLRPPTFFGLIPWVNVYTVTRAFGGSEEGGWYYRQYTCVKSQQVWLWDAEVTEAMFLRTYEGLAWGLLCKEAAGQEVVVRIERRRAALQYAEKPAYDPEIVLESAVKLTSKTQKNIVRSTPFPIMKPTSSTFSSISQKKNSIQMMRTASLDEEPCERCKGSGRTRYLHIKNGICFLCGGSGEKSKQKQEILNTEPSVT